MAKDTIKDHKADRTMERSDWTLDQTDFDNKSYNDDQFEDFEHGKEFEDSLGFDEDPEDIMEDIETKGISS